MENEFIKNSQDARVFCKRLGLRLPGHYDGVVGRWERPLQGIRKKFPILARGVPILKLRLFQFRTPEIFQSLPVRCRIRHFLSMGLGDEIKPDLLIERY